MKPLIALVTGASSGIGQATALALHAEGYTVYGAARRLDHMKVLEEAGIRTVQLDVINNESITKALSAIGRVDVLINNAGYGSYGAIEDVPLSEARRQMDVNVFGLARLCQLVIPGMRRRHLGTIVNISSIGGKFGEPFGGWYHATKYAVEGLSDSLRLELKPFGIKVIVIEPGLIKTEWATIAAENLLKSSGDGAYHELAQKHVGTMRRYSTNRLASSPDVVAQGIVKVLKKSNPKYRYAIGGGAKPILALRKVTGDRLFYKLLSL